MNGVELLRNTKSLHAFSSLYTCTGQASLASALGLPIYPAFNTFPIGCISKPVGALQFTLNSVKQLGLATPADFDLVFSGAVAPGGSAQPNVLWSVDQTVDINIVSSSGLNVHVHRVYGSWLTETGVFSPPFNSTDCNGAATVYTGYFGWLEAFDSPWIPSAMDVNLTFEGQVLGRLAILQMYFVGLGLDIGPTEVGVHVPPLRFPHPIYTPKEDPWWGGRTLLSRDAQIAIWIRNLAAQIGDTEARRTIEGETLRLTVKGAKELVAEGGRQQPNMEPLSHS